MTEKILSLTKARDDAEQRRFVTQVAVQGIGMVLLEGRHAHVYQSAVKGKMPFVRFDVGDQTFCFPLGVVLMVVEGPASDLRQQEPPEGAEEDIAQPAPIPEETPPGPEGAA